jgi:hypothetical protein
MTQEKPIPGIVVPTVEGKEFKGLAFPSTVYYGFEDEIVSCEIKKVKE